MNTAKLEAALSEAARAGPHEFPLASLADLQAAAKNLGFPLAHIDLARARDKDDLLAALAIALNLPDWFGHNWDALGDCLSDLSWKPASGYLIFIEGHDSLRASHPADFSTLMEIFSEAAEHWRESGVPFWALLSPAGDGKRLLDPLIE